MSKVSVQVYLSEEEKAVAESLQQNSRRDPEMFDMSLSEAAREVYRIGIENLDDKPKARELVDDVAVEKFQVKKERERVKDRAWLKDMRGGWRGRVRGYVEARLEGPEPYSPDVIEDLATDYWAECQIHHDDPERLQEHREWLDDLLEEYREAYEVKQMVPSETFADVDDEVATGSDLYRLRDQIEPFLTDLAEVAEGGAFDVDGIIRRLAGDYAVEEATVELVVEELTGDDVDARRALKSGEGLLDAVDASALEAWGGDPDAIEAEVDADRGDDDDRPDGEPEPEQETDHQEAAVEAVEEPVDADGVRTEVEGEVEETESPDVVDVDGREVRVPDSEARAPDADRGDDADGVEAGGYDPADLATEEAIEAAVDAIEAGETDDKKVRLHLRKAGVTSGENERKAAVAAARDRLDADRGDADADGEPEEVDVQVEADGGQTSPRAATDGGEARD